MINPIQRSAFDGEMSAARQLVADGNLDAAFAHLERAHVIGQNYVLPHVASHWLMLVVEVRRRQFAAVFGQLLRIVLGALGSAVGIVPTGNTGGTNVSMFRRMTIDAELQDLVEGRAPGDRGRQRDFNEAS